MPALLLPTLAMVDMPPATHIEAHRALLATAMAVMDMEVMGDMASVRLSLDMVVLLTIPMVAAALFTEPPKA